MTHSLYVENVNALTEFAKSMNCSVFVAETAVNYIKGKLIKLGFNENMTRFVKFV